MRPVGNAAFVVCGVGFLAMTCATCAIHGFAVVADPAVVAAEVLLACEGDGVLVAVFAPALVGDAVVVAVEHGLTPTSEIAAVAATTTRTPPWGGTPAPSTTRSLLRRKYEHHPG